MLFLELLNLISLLEVQRNDRQSRTKCTAVRRIIVPRKLSEDVQIALGQGYQKQLLVTLLLRLEWVH